jgi:hypothetical protein
MCCVIRIEQLLWDTILNQTSTAIFMPDIRAGIIDCRAFCKGTITIKTLNK